MKHTVLLLLKYYCYDFYFEAPSGSSLIVTKVSNQLPTPCCQCSFACTSFYKGGMVKEAATVNWLDKEVQVTRVYCHLR